jgi:hypothetical protein
VAYVTPLLREVGLVKNLLLIPVLGALGVFSLYQARSPNDVISDILVAERKPSAVCRFNNLIPSLDGTGVVVSQKNVRFQDERDFRSPTSFVVISQLPSVNQSLENFKSRIHIIGSKSARAQPLFWSDRQLLFRVGETKLYNATLERDWKFDSRDINAAWANVDITINSPLGLRGIDNERNVKTAAVIGSEKNLRRQSAYLSNESFFSVIDLKNEQKLLVGQNENLLSSIGQGAFFTTLIFFQKKIFRFLIITATEVIRNGRNLTQPTAKLLLIFLAVIR